MNFLKAFAARPSLLQSPSLGRRTSLLLGLLACLPGMALAQAPTWPNKPIKVLTSSGGRRQFSVLKANKVR